MADVDPLRPAPGADPFLFDAERLQALASEAVVRRGVAYFNEHRVVSLGWDEARLWAEVQGSQPELAYQVDVALDEDREPLACCTCPFDLEPACKHVVAALMAYAAQIDLAEVESAAEQAIAERQRRARTEVVVQHLAGELTFGTWAARSVSDAGASLRPYRVHLRSTTERINACSCPDFAGNRLGTCKHIEAVLHRLAKRHIDAHEPALPVVYLAWPGASDDGAPAIAVRRPRSVAPEVAALLERHFDPRGTLRGALPEAWDAVEQDLGQRDDVHLGDDARAHALRVATDLAHARRGEAIRDAITRSGGHLPGVRARLYPYQTEGVAMLASAGRALLADDMGLGKTLQAIAAARWLFDHAGVARVLVVCPASLKAQWAREVRRFTGLDAVVVEGGAAPRLAQYRQHAPFTIVNYEIVVRDQSAIAAALGPDLLVLDEAQRIKNWRTKTAAAIKAIETRYAFVLSGTPLENRLEDLYSVMQVVDARVLGPLWQFMRRFHVSDERGKVVAYRNLSELRRRLAPVMLRRDKRVVRTSSPSASSRPSPCRCPSASRSCTPARCSWPDATPR
ncbi:MAG: SNF2-related protein [Myxococcota bacterium]